MAAADEPIRLFATAAAWERWLAKHHDGGGALWLRIAKAGSGLKSVTYAEALDVALCWGWIDGQKKPEDASAWLQRFTPRTARSPWSQRNREHVDRLVAAKRMQPPGLAAVEAARQDGRWDRAYAPASTAKVPADLQAALDGNPKARAFFAALNGANRYAILYRVQQAVRPETRARRIAQFVEMLARGEKIHG
ncbi:YdeI/OmpD-associated family protein [Ramlibacter sp.]|uniref:YdeI/OmpD-associated family protein n=1 Tax=Ramlibacter sp. TaxID=1917967 RepID=UPI0017B75A4A|nr:YdeI/OmpD-associated family protein [Ramlibacter sp.]MBA2672653.1 YdeI/OmpD-associated family protein [Ramlibacter sp.]